MKRLKQLPEFVRFVMVGIFATALHYGLYFVLQRVINVNIAYTLGYALSFIANFYLTAYFTFGRKPSWRKAFGFGGVLDRELVITIKGSFLTSVRKAQSAN